MSQSKTSIKITVTGRVQGVGFRRACLREARFRGITGFVRNNSDGKVYIEAEGNPEQLGELIKWCWKGPGFGRVEDVAVESSVPENFSSFDVRYV